MRSVGTAASLPCPLDTPVTQSMKTALYPSDAPRCSTDVVTLSADSGDQPPRFDHPVAGRTGSVGPACHDRCNDRRERGAAVGALISGTISGPERLAELDLTVDAIAIALAAADHESAQCSDLDPPILAGLLRWGRATRALREQLVPLGWTYDKSSQVI